VGRPKTGPKANADEFNKTFATNLSRLMERKGLTAPQLAAILGKSDNLVYQYLRAVTMPQLRDLPSLASALGIRDYRRLLPEPSSDDSEETLH
jgi:transcriptional regulator with XRE-family HTH domain